MNLQTSFQPGEGLRSFSRRLVPSFWDLPAFALLLGAFLLVAQAGRETLQPLSSIAL